MKRILINATHNEEVRVALCKDNHLYDFDLENRTREQKKANIYKGHITRVEPSLEAVFVEYGSMRQGFLPLREVAPEYLKGNPRTDNIRDIIKEGDEVIVQVEKEERGNKGAALSTYISLAGRYLVLMPNNAKAGGISRQISGKVREETKNIIASLSIPRGMSVIVRTAGVGKGFDDLQTDLDHLLEIWQTILTQNKSRPSPCLVHQEAGVVTRAVRDYLRDDIGEVWIDSEHAYNEAASFIAAVMPNQMGKLRKYTDYEPLFTRFGIERQIETAYQREVRLPSGGSIVIDQTEALVSIDINSAKSTKGSDVAETAYHTNLEAADEIARQLRLRDMGGLIVIDFIDMNETRHQKDVEKRLIDATRYDRARVQFAEISRFGLMEMSRQRLRPSLEESTGYICPRCHGNGMIRDLRSLALSIMRQIEQIALKERTGEIQAEVPTEIAAFLLNEKRESLVYLEQDSGARITILPHAHLESPNFSLHFNPDGFAPSSYERIVDVEERETGDLGYDTNWHTKASERAPDNRWQKTINSQSTPASAAHAPKNSPSKTKSDSTKPASEVKPQAVAWLANLFAPKPQASLAGELSSDEVASAIESLVNAGNVSLGSTGSLGVQAIEKPAPKRGDDKHGRRRPKKDELDKSVDRTLDKSEAKSQDRQDKKHPPARDHQRDSQKDTKDTKDYPKRELGSQRSPRGEVVRGETLTAVKSVPQDTKDAKLGGADKADHTPRATDKKPANKPKPVGDGELALRVVANPVQKATSKTVHLSLDGSKPLPAVQADEKIQPADQAEQRPVKQTKLKHSKDAEVTPPTSEATTSPPKSERRTAKKPAAKPTKCNGLVPNLERIAQLTSQTGRAANDPRVVFAALGEAQSVTKLNQQESKPALTGTAGQFVASLIDQRTDSFVADFLQAMSLYHADTPPSVVLSESSSVQAMHDLSVFANYGFDSLTADELMQFTQHITPQGQFAVADGKTEVMPPLPGARAINDPRGAYVAQPSTHADTILPNADETQASQTDAMPAQAVETTINVDEVAIASEQANAMLDGLTNDVDQPASMDVINADVGDATPQSDSADGLTQTIHEMAESLQQATLEVMQGIGELFAGDEVADAQTSSTPDQDLNAQDAAESSKDAPKPKRKSRSDAQKPSVDDAKNSTIANYKNMIENVAEQLLPQVGILNLAVPKSTRTTKTAKPKVATAIKPKISPKKTRTSNKPKAEVVKKAKVNETGLQDKQHIQLPQDD